MEGERELWIDTVYMAVPALAGAGLFDEAWLQFVAHRDRLFDSESGLYGWRWNEDGQRMTHPEHWGTGTGWVLAAIARTIRIVGDSDSRYVEDAASHARIVIDACLALRRNDGLFHNVLDDPSTFTEGNVAQMLAYAIFTGVHDGWLPASYADAGRSLVVTARSLVDEHGFVRKVCGAPWFDQQGTSAEAQSFFLLATAAEKRLT